MWHFLNEWKSEAHENVAFSFDLQNMFVVGYPSDAPQHRAELLHGELGGLEGCERFADAWDADWATSGPFRLGQNGEDERLVGLHGLESRDIAYRQNVSARELGDAELGVGIRAREGILARTRMHDAVRQSELPRMDAGIPRADRRRQNLLLCPLEQ
jgi:hypothetical protein